MTEVEEIVRKAKIGRRLLVVVVTATCLGTLYAIAVNVGQGTDITNIQKVQKVQKVQKTQCTLHAAGKACTKIKERIALTGSLKNMCIEHQRVEGTKGRNCPHFYIPVTEHQAAVDLEPGGARGSPPDGSTATAVVSPTGNSAGPAKPHPAATGPAPQHAGEGGSPPASVPGTDTASAPAEGQSSASAEAQAETAPTHTEPPPVNASTPGVINSPGGLLGEIVCSVNHLTGLTVCTE